MREAVGPDVELQILTRSVSGVTLTTQALPALTIQAQCMAKHCTTWDRKTVELPRRSDCCIL